MRGPSLGWRATHVFRAGAGLVMTHVITPRSLQRMKAIPSLPRWFRRKYAAVQGPWPDLKMEIPPELLTQPGIARDDAEETSAYKEQPLYSFHHNYGVSVLWALQRLWPSMIP